MLYILGTWPTYRFEAPLCDSQRTLPPHAIAGNHAHYYFTAGGDVSRLCRGAIQRPRPVHLVSRVLVPRPSISPGFCRPPHQLPAAAGSGRGVLGRAFFQWPAHWASVALQNGMKIIDIEEGREALGLVICTLALLLYSQYVTGSKAKAA